MTQDPDPPEAEQLVEAALRFREVLRAEDRTTAELADYLRALGRAVDRLAEVYEHDGP